MRPARRRTRFTSGSGSILNIGPGRISIDDARGRSNVDIASPFVFPASGGKDVRRGGDAAPAEEELYGRGAPGSAGHRESFGAPPSDGRGEMGAARRKRGAAADAGRRRH